MRVTQHLVPVIVFLLIGSNAVAQTEEPKNSPAATSSLDNYKTIAEIAQSAATVIALVVGGTWTYFLFVRNRLGYPAVQVQIMPQHVWLPNNKRLIHVAVTVENIGKVKWTASEAELRLRAVVPLPDDVEELVNEGFDPVPPKRTEIEFPMVAGRNWSWDAGDFEIEPEEDDTLHSDFVIDARISVVEFYFFIDNAKKKTGMGWPTTLVHELPELRDSQ